MTRIFLILLLAAISLTSPAFAGTYNRGSTGTSLVVTTAANLPVTGNSLLTYRVTTATNASDCDRIDSGSALAECRWNGSAYEAIGVAVSGLVNPLNANLDVGRKDFLNLYKVGGALYFATTQAEFVSALGRCGQYYGGTASTGCTIQLACGTFTWDDAAIGAFDSGSASHSGVTLRGCGGGGLTASGGGANDTGGSTVLNATQAKPMLSLFSCATCRVEHVVLDGNDIATIGIDWGDTGGGFPSTQGVIEDVHIHHINGPAIRTGYNETAITTLTRSGTTATATSTGHGLAEAEDLVIAGASDANFNGTKLIHVVDANTFTYPVANTGATSATGAKFTSHLSSKTQVDSLTVSNSILDYNDSCYEQLHSQSIGMIFKKVTCANSNNTGTIDGVDVWAGELEYDDGYFGANANDQIFINRRPSASRITIRNNQTEWHGTTGGYFLKDDDTSGQGIGATLMAPAIVDGNAVVYAGAMTFISAKREGSYQVSNNMLFNQGTAGQAATSSFASDIDPYTQDRLVLNQWGNIETEGGGTPYPETWKPTLASDVILGTTTLANATAPNDCLEGQLWVDTDAASGRRIYACQSGAWVLQGDGGSNGEAAVFLTSTYGTGITGLNGAISACQTAGGGVVQLAEGATTIDATSIASPIITLPAGSYGGRALCQLVGYGDVTSNQWVGSGNESQVGGSTLIVTNSGSKTVLKITGHDQVLSGFSLVTPNMTAGGKAILTENRAHEALAAGEQGLGGLDWKHVSLQGPYPDAARAGEGLVLNGTQNGHYLGGQIQGFTNGIVFDKHPSFVNPNNANSFRSVRVANNDVGLVFRTNGIGEQNDLFGMTIEGNALGASFLSGSDMRLVDYGSWWENTPTNISIASAPSVYIGFSPRMGSANARQDIVRSVANSRGFPDSVDGGLLVSGVSYPNGAGINLSNQVPIRTDTVLSPYHLADSSDERWYAIDGAKALNYCADAFSLPAGGGSTQTTGTPDGWCDSGGFQIACADLWSVPAGGASVQTSGSPDGWCDSGGSRRVGKSKVVGHESRVVNMTATEAYGDWLTVQSPSDTDTIGRETEVFCPGGSKAGGDEGCQAFRSFVTDAYYASDGTISGTLAAGSGAATITIASGVDTDDLIGEGRLIVFPTNSSAGALAQDVQLTSVPPGTLDTNPLPGSYAAGTWGTGTKTWGIEVGKIASQGFGPGWALCPINANYLDPNGVTMRECFEIVSCNSGTNTCETSWISQGREYGIPYGTLAEVSVASAAEARMVPAVRVDYPIFANTNDRRVDQIAVVRPTGFPGTSSGAAFALVDNPGHTTIGATFIVGRQHGAEGSWSHTGIKIMNSVYQGWGGRQGASAIEFGGVAPTSSLIDGAKFHWLTGNRCLPGGCETGFRYDFDANYPYGQPFMFDLDDANPNGTYTIGRIVESYEGSMTYDADNFGFGVGIATREPFLRASFTDDSINGGVPNGSGARVHWSQLLGVPAGFADGFDASGGGGGITSVGDCVTGACFPTLFSSVLTNTLFSQASFGIQLDEDATANNAFVVYRDDGIPIFNMTELGALTLGSAGSAVGTIRFQNATSGTATLSPPTGALGTYTVTLPNAASTLPIFSQQVTFTGPTAARSIVLPDEAFTVAGIASPQTFTNKTLDAEGTGNLLTTVEKVWFPAAGCNNVTPASFYDLPTTNPAGAACVTGTNTQKGVLDFDANTSESAQVTHILPADWTGAIDVRLKWFSASNASSVAWNIQTACVADGETDDPAFNAATAIVDAAKATINQTNDASATGITITGCGQSELLHIRISRDVANGSDAMTGDARLVGFELTYRRAI